MKNEKIFWLILAGIAIWALKDVTLILKITPAPSSGDGTFGGFEGGGAGGGGGGVW